MSDENDDEFDDTDSFGAESNGAESNGAEGDYTGDDTDLYLSV